MVYMKRDDEEAMSYCAVAYPLVEYPGASATAVRISDVETVIGPEYKLE
jgi:hypothetical protein